MRAMLNQVLSIGKWSLTDFRDRVSYRRGVVRNKQISRTSVFSGPPVGIEYLFNALGHSLESSITFTSSSSDEAIVERLQIVFLQATELALGVD